MREAYQVLQNKYSFILDKTHRIDLTSLEEQTRVTAFDKLRTQVKELLDITNYEDFYKAAMNLPDLKITYNGVSVLKQLIITLDELLGRPGGGGPADFLQQALININEIKSIRNSRRQSDPLIVHVQYLQKQTRELFDRWLQSEEYAARKAQQQHTSTHGVDLTSLEETENYLPNKVLLDWLKSLPAIEPFLEWFNEIAGPHYLHTPGPLNWTLPALADFSKEYLKKFYDEFLLSDKYREWKAMHDAQTQHTSTHGVDLTQLEESSNFEPGLKQVVDWMKTLPAVEPFVEWIKQDTPGITSLEDVAISYYEDSIYEEKRKMYDRGHDPLTRDAELHQKAIEGAIEGVKNTYRYSGFYKSKLYQDWLAIRNAQQQHTKTHGVDLSNLEEKYKIVLENSEARFAIPNLTQIIKDLVDIRDYNLFSNTIKTLFNSFGKNIFALSDHLLLFYDASSPNKKILKIVVKTILNKLNQAGEKDNYLLKMALVGAFWQAVVSTVGKECNQNPYFQPEEAFKEWRNKVEEPEKVKTAQRQHTATHGVDLSNI